jgi:hypothetical protein
MKDTFVLAKDLASSHVCMIMESQTIRSPLERLLSKEHPLSTVILMRLNFLSPRTLARDCNLRDSSFVSFHMHMPAYQYSNYNSNSNSNSLDSLRAYTRSYFQPIPPSSTPRLPFQPPFNSTELALLLQARRYVHRGPFSSPSSQGHTDVKPFPCTTYHILSTPAVRLS